MFFKKFGLLVSLFAFVAFANNAQAITINGKDFTKILALHTGNDFGYWTGPQKFFTFVGNDNYQKPDNVSVTYRDSSLAGINFAKANVTGATTAPGTGTYLSTDLAMGVVSLYTASNQLLLTATYAEAGKLNAIYKAGAAGELDVSGIFNVTGGSLFTSGLITGALYIDVAFNNVWQNKYKDLKTSNGTFTFYKQVGGVTTGGNGTTGGTTGGTQIPEPASVTLLASSLIGLLSRRSRK